MKHLSFDEIVRNLLVYLKGQIPSLNSKETRDEVLRQVQNITFTLRSSIVQLEGAASSTSRNSEDLENLQREISALKNTNAKLEESLFLEMNKTQELSEKAAKGAIEADPEEIKELEEKVRKLEEELHKLESEKLQPVPLPEPDYEQIESLKAEVGQLQTELSSARIELAKAHDSTEILIDPGLIEELKDQIVQLEEQLHNEAETSALLRQSAQEKEIELMKAKNTLAELLEVNKTEIATLKQQVEEYDIVKDENKALQKRVAELQTELKSLPPLDVFQNTISSSDAKIKHLEKALLEAQTECQNFRTLEKSTGVKALKAENEKLQQRIVDLEATLRSVIKSRETGRAEKFTFTPEECVFLFETLSTTVFRLAQSPENRDLYKKAGDAIVILEKSNAIQRIPSVGEHYDLKVHKVAKSFKNDFLPDGIIIHEESPGFVSGNHLIQKSVVWVGKSSFNCSECENVCRNHEFFCPKCGLELTAPDGSSKREIDIHPRPIDLNVRLIDVLLDKGDIKSAKALIEFVAIEHPENEELNKRKALLLTAENDI